MEDELVEARGADLTKRRSLAYDGDQPSNVGFYLFANNETSVISRLLERMTDTLSNNLRLRSPESKAFLRKSSSLSKGYESSANKSLTG